MPDSKHTSFLQDGVDLGPEVGEQAGGVLVLVWPDRPVAMPMVAGLCRTSARTARSPYRMRIVEPDQTTAVFTMQGQRTVQAMRPVGVGSTRLARKRTQYLAASSVTNTSPSRQGVEASVPLRPCIMGYHEVLTIALAFRNNVHQRPVP